MECTCEGSFYPDSMCKPCLRIARDKLKKRIEVLQERIDDLDGDLNQVNFHLDEEDLELD